MTTFLNEIIKEGGNGLITGIIKTVSLNGLEDTGRGKGKLGQSERVAWTYIRYQM